MEEVSLLNGINGNRAWPLAPWVESGPFERPGADVLMAADPTSELVV